MLGAEFKGNTRGAVTVCVGCKFNPGKSNGMRNDKLFVLLAVLFSW